MNFDDLITFEFKRLAGNDSAHQDVVAFYVNNRERINVTKLSSFYNKYISIIENEISKDMEKTFGLITEE